MKRALVTGITGQLGFFVARQLIAEGVEVHGLVRRGAKSEGDLPFRAIQGDLGDEYSLFRAVELAAPDEVYHLAAQTHVGISWEQPMVTLDQTGTAVVRLLETVRRIAPRARCVFASSSEIFAGAGVSPQDEQTPIVPRNPYGAAKAFAFHTVRAYREKYGLHASSAILYTNESIRRPGDFLFRKVTQGVARIVADGGGELVLGNLDVIRDWGASEDHAAAMVRMARAERPEDFVIATGEGRTVRELVALAFRLVDLDPARHVRTESEHYRSAEPAPMIGNAARIRRALGHAPRLGFDALVRRVLAHDLRLRGQPVPFEEPAPL